MNWQECLAKAILDAQSRARTGSPLTQKEFDEAIGRIKIEVTELYEGIEEVTDKLPSGQAGQDD